MILISQNYPVYDFKYVCRLWHYNVFYLLTEIITLIWDRRCKESFSVMFGCRCHNKVKPNKNSLEKLFTFETIWKLQEKFHDRKTRFFGFPVSWYKDVDTFQMFFFIQFSLDTKIMILKSFNDSKPLYFAYLDCWSLENIECFTIIQNTECLIGKLINLFNRLYG